MVNSRLQAIIAEELSVLLLETYQFKHSPQMKSDFAVAGFTRDSLINSPEILFMMIITASYDRRPFTGEVGGYEYIWGIKAKEASLPNRFKRIGLSNPDVIKALNRDDIRDRLKAEVVKETALDGVDKVDYTKTFIDVATSTSRLHELLLKAKTPNDVTTIYNTINQIHGIGDTIAAKLTKYLLREIAIGEIQPNSFPLTVVWPLVNEYHNEQALIKLRRVGSDVVPLTMGLLLVKGDPFALDALFYLNRYEPRLLDEFISDVSQWAYGGSKAKDPMIMKEKAIGPPDSNKQKATLLLAVIKDVCDDIEGITKDQLLGLAQPHSLKAAATKLYKGMAVYASKGDTDSMFRYYKNCLGSEASKWDWLLDKIGRKSLKSEWERFQAIFNDEIKG